MRSLIDRSWSGREWSVRWWSLLFSSAVCFKWWCRPALCAQMERQGEEGRAQPKSGGPADPKGETPLAYMRSKRKEGGRTDGQRPVPQLAGAAAQHQHHHHQTSSESQADRAAAVTARGGGRGVISWNSALGMETLAPGFPMPAKQLLPL